MTFPKDPNSLLTEVKAKYGAPMGRPTSYDDLEATVILFRVRFVDGDYDVGGVYWGGGKDSQPLYAAIGDDFQHFLRADSLAEAKQELLEEYPDLKVQTTAVNDDFLAAYIEAALSSTNEENEEPFDRFYSADNLHPDALAAVTEDCRLFLEQNSHLINDETCLEERDPFSQAGHDFWMTRHHDGVGFWETDDWRETEGQLLTEAAQKFRETHLFILEGKVYIE